jgi:hypothetical protein
VSTIDDTLEHDGRKVSDDERQATLVLMPKVAKAARELAASVSGNGTELTRGELARALHQMARQLAQLNSVVLRKAVADDGAEVDLDDLRRHVLTVHAYGAAMDSTEEVVQEVHRKDHADEHGISHHPETDHYWDPLRVKEAIDAQARLDAMLKGGVNE